jgi:hypothetical protein
VENLVQVVFQPLGGHTDLFKHRRNHALAVLNQRQEHVHRLHFGVAQFRGMRLRLLHRLLRLHRKSIPTDGHDSSDVSS